MGNSNRFFFLKIFFLKKKHSLSYFFKKKYFCRNFTRNNSNYKYTNFSKIKHFKYKFYKQNRFFCKNNFFKKIYSYIYYSYLILNIFFFDITYNFYKKNNCYFKLFFKKICFFKKGRFFKNVRFFIFLKKFFKNFFFWFIFLFPILLFYFFFFLYFIYENISYPDISFFLKNFYNYKFIKLMHPFPVYLHTNEWYFLYLSESDKISFFWKIFYDSYWDFLFVDFFFKESFFLDDFLFISNSSSLFFNYSFDWLCYDGNQQFIFSYNLK